MCLPSGPETQEIDFSPIPTEYESAPSVSDPVCVLSLDHRKESQRHTDSLRYTARRGSTEPASGWASALRVRPCLCSMFCVLSLDHRKESQTH